MKPVTLVFKQLAIGTILQIGVGYHPIVVLLLSDTWGPSICLIQYCCRWPSDEKCKEYELRMHVIKWVIIDAHHLGYDEYIALLYFYGKHSQTYWHPLIKDAYAMAMSYYNKERGTEKFIDLSFVNITHFSAVVHLMNHETSVEMDVSMVKFANVNVDSVHYFQTTDFTHLH